MEFNVIIPARYHSTRLPGKVLLDIGGKPMLQHVYERALQSGARSVVVATEEQRVKEAAEAWGANVCLTSHCHQSGTERLAETIAQLGYQDDEIIVNLQGDEPLMPPSLIRQVAGNLVLHHEADIATICEPIRDVKMLFNPSVVKVVMDCRGYALYFSRAPIPWERDNFAQEPESLSQENQHYRHLGLYAYRAGFLQAYVHWSGCYLETAESLEQLRVLWQGGRIHVALGVVPGAPSVDTAADLETVRKMLKNVTDSTTNAGQ